MFSTLDELAFRHRAPGLVLAVAPLAWAALALPPPAGEARLAGAALVLAGGALRLCAVRRLGKRARVSRARAEHLVRGGPYAWLRNPLYLAALTVIAGAGLLVGLGAWTLLPTLAAWWLYDRAVRHEERALLQVQGPLAAGYLQRVPRWVPRPWRRGPEDDAERVAWPEVLRREWRLVVWLPLLIAGALGLGSGPGLTIKAQAAQLGPWLPAGVTLAALLGAAGNAIKSRRDQRRRARRRAAQLGVEQGPLDLQVHALGVAERGVADGASGA